MFSNIGDKIQILAEVVCRVGIVACVLGGVGCVVSGIANEMNSAIIFGILIALLGPLFCWISTFTLYGFGKLIENSQIIAEKLAPEYRESTEEIDDIELEEIGEIYLNSSWKDGIQKLSNKELSERINSEHWQLEYRMACKKELESRIL